MADRRGVARPVAETEGVRGSSSDRFSKLTFRSTTWFTDPELNRWLGPMGDEWLEAVLSETVSGGATWAVFGGAKLIAVMETVMHPDNRSLAAITGLAVRPDLRGRGFGRAVLDEVLVSHRRSGRPEHLAYIHQDNGVAQLCFRRAGFMRVTPTPNGEGYLEFRA